MYDKANGKDINVFDFEIESRNFSGELELI